MARRKQGGDGTESPRNARINKRKPREGIKRALNLVMLDENATRLEAIAVLCKSTPAEVIQDFVEAATWRMRLTIPGVGNLFGRGVVENRKPTPQELLQLLIDALAQPSGGAIEIAGEASEEGLAAA